MTGSGQSLKCGGKSAACPYASSQGDGLVTSPRVPQLGCGAAILAEDRLLLIRRRRPPEAGHWGLPGGKVDWGERVIDAVVREIAEELGIEIRCRRLLTVADQIHEDSHWVAPVYLAEITAGRPEVKEPEALAGAEWFALDRLPAPLTIATRAALDALNAGGDTP